jgi:hypothetical protein
MAEPEPAMEAEWLPERLPVPVPEQVPVPVPVPEPARFQHRPPG